MFKSIKTKYKEYFSKEQFNTIVNTEKSYIDFRKYFDYEKYKYAVLNNLFGCDYITIVDDEFEKTFCILYNNVDPILSDILAILAAYENKDTLSNILLYLINNPFFNKKRLNNLKPLIPYMNDIKKTLLFT